MAQQLLTVAGLPTWTYGNTIRYFPVEFPTGILSIPRNERFAVKKLRGFPTKYNKPSELDIDAMLLMDHVHDTIAVHVLKRYKDLQLHQLAKELQLPYAEDLTDREFPLDPSAENQNLTVNKIMVHWDECEKLSFSWRGPLSEPMLVKTFANEEVNPFLARLSLELICLDKSVKITNPVLNIRVILSRPLLCNK